MEINIIRLSPAVYLLTQELEQPRQPGDGRVGENGKWLKGLKMEGLKRLVFMPQYPGDLVSMQQNKGNPRYANASGKGHQQDTLKIPHKVTTSSPSTASLWGQQEATQVGTRITLTK